MGRVTEVAVRRPARGWIDLVLHDALAAQVVAVEIQSELRRLEQLIRWSGEKAASLPSWEGYARIGSVATTFRLLVVRRTRATRTIARDFASQLAVAYPAHPEDALAALTDGGSWPGDALLWVDERADRGVRFMHRRASPHAIIRGT